MSSTKGKQSGFTIVELLIVIVAVGILATITIVAYNGIQKRATFASMSSDLANAAKYMELEKVNSTTDMYADTLPAQIKSSSGTVLQLAKITGPQPGFCINAYRSSPYAVLSLDSMGKEVKQHLCAGPTIGNAVGGSTPTTPRGVNLTPDFSAWTMSGGVTYNPSTKELSFNGDGSATSPLIRIDSPYTATLQVESYANASAPHFAPDAGAHFSSSYFGADGVASVQNSTGHISNGNATRMPISTWNNKSWITPAGAGVVYVRFQINSSPTIYTSDNKVRNPTVTVSD